MSPIPAQDRSPKPATASAAFWLISATGLVPFLVCLGLILGVPSLKEAAVQAFLVYSALTLTFLGGARWGAELVRSQQRDAGALDLMRLILAAGPSIVGLGALLPQTPTRLAIGLLLASSAAQLLWDVQASRDGLLPAWNATVRIALTACGTICTLALWWLL